MNIFFFEAIKNYYSKQIFNATKYG